MSNTSIFIQNADDLLQSNKQTKLQSNFNSIHINGQFWRQKIFFKIEYPKIPNYP